VYKAYLWQNMGEDPRAMDEGMLAIGRQFFAIEKLALMLLAGREIYSTEYDSTEEWLVDALNETFRNVKNFAIVVAHYEIGSSESDDLVFMDAIDLNDALAIYRSVGEEDIEPRAIPVHPLLAEKQIDGDLMEKLRNGLSYK